ncbi:MAG TPA: BTAD domain-containing putative transcriptional regulator [Amycolatopsis sp.]|nr:BTAD domain-containing putative transcriptional regulator [Amycolatopsis sp.]
MRFGILGPTQAWTDDGTPIVLGGPRSRALLALLLLEAGRVTPTDRLIDGLYGENPPREATNALQSQVSRLRRGLGSDMVEFHPAGYRLRVDPDQVDLHRFTRLARAGREALAAGRPAAGAKLLAEALELWRGPAEVPEPEATRLLELRLSAAEDHAEAELTSGGDPHEIVTGLQDLVARHPFRERARGLLMRALQADGRQAEALTVFEATRRTLAEELGTDPSPALAETHRTILTAEGIRPTGVPAQLTSFVGREPEIRRIHELFDTARLVTVTGPGGMGKTRLAIQASTGDACFVDLAPLTDGTQLPRTVLAALGLRETRIFGAPGSEPTPMDRLTTALAERRVLLILDNCEHVIADAAALVHRLLTACPGLRVLATSREPLDITGEALCPLPPLSPDRAVRLFTDRARAASPDFTAEIDEGRAEIVSRICQRLDGLPLAIELAAARLRSLSLSDLETRLDDRFRVLSRGSRTAAARHRTLHAVINWSWDLLDEAEQRLLRRLSVFAGGVTAGSAVAVLSEVDPTARDAAIDSTVDIENLLESLADKSLLETSSGRYRMLDTIREFSAARLTEAGEHERFSRAHTEHFLDLARTSDPHLRRAEQLTWLARLSTEHANLQAALRWSVSSDSGLALRLIGALTTYWRLRGLRGEIAPLARRLLDGLEPGEGLEQEYVLAVLSTLPRPPAGTLEKASAIMRTQSLQVRQPAVLVDWALFTGPPDPRETQIPLHDQFTKVEDPWLQALAHFSLSYLRIMHGELSDAEAEFGRALAGFRSTGDRWGIAQVLDGLATLAHQRGDWERALALTEAAIEEITPLGAVDEIAEFSCRRATLLMLDGRLQEAEAGYRRAAELAGPSGVPATTAMVYLGSGRLAHRRGDLADARERFRLALAACGPDWQSLGVRAQVLTSLALLEKDGVRAAHLLGVAASIGATIRDPEIIGRARRLLDEAAYEEAFAGGAAMSRAAALDFVGAAERPETSSGDA